MSKEFDLQMDASNHLSKMCWNCDGHVNMDAHFCSYCGSDLYRLKEEEEKKQSQKKLSSLYQPPYNPTQGPLGVPGFEDHTGFSYDTELGDEEVSFEEEEKVEKPKTDMGVWPLLFLSLGMNLMTLGLLLFFFSNGSYLTLEWNSHYWFIYCILSTPFLMFGWKLLKASPSFEEEA